MILRTKSSNKLRSALAAGTLLSATVASTSQATILVSESFDYTSTSTFISGSSGPTRLSANISGQNGGTGFAAAWANGGNPKVAASGLTMAGVFSSGNAAQWDLDNGVSGSISRQLSTSVATSLSSGVYYGSYLFNISGAVGSTSLTGIGTAAQGSNTSDNKASYVFAGKGYNLSTTANTSFTPGLRTNIAANSQSGAGGSYTALSGGQSLSLNTTYIMLFQVDPTTFTTQSWVLNAAQLANFSSSLDAATLNAAATGSGSANVLSKGSFTATSAPDIQTFLDMYQAGVSGQTTVIDEIRFSNAGLTEAVTAVPEPSSVALLLSGLCSFAVIRRWRRRQTALS